MAATRREDTEAFVGRPLEVLGGFEAIARAERAICRGAVARDPAGAEGLALAGVRAASLHDGNAPGNATSGAGGVAVAGTSCVHHLDDGAGVERGGAFELSSASVQEAVDHCLVAHLLSQRLGRPGLCSLATSLAEKLALLCLPDRELIDDVLGEQSGSPELEADAERILELAREAAREVAGRTGRPAELVDYDGTAKAGVVLVGSGACAAQAREAARALSKAGVKAGALSLNLLRPFPEALVRTALASARTVLLVEAPERRGALLARVRGAIDKQARAQAIDPAPPAELLQAVAKHLPKGSFDPKRHLPVDEPLGRRLVVAPAGAWGQETARLVVSALGQLVPLRLAPRTRRHLGCTILVWGSESLAERDDDLLLASHPALLEPRGALGLARRGGTVVVLSAAKSSDELAGSLGATSRAALRERELRVYWLTPPDPLPDPRQDQPGGEAERAASSMLTGAALSLLGIPGSEAVEAVATRLEASGRGEEARWLRAGPAQLRALDPEDLDPARHLEEVDFRASSTLPDMPEPAEDREQRERWAGRIRRFHLTGEGAFSPASGLPVQPAVLRGLAGALRAASSQPFVLVPSGETERPIAARALRHVLAEACEALKSPALGDRSDRLATLAVQLLRQRSAGATLGTLIADAGRRLVAELALPQDRELPVCEALEELRRLLPDAVTLDLRAETPAHLYRAVVDAVREPLRRRFVAELEGLREGLRDLLEVDRRGSSEGRQPQALAAALGSAAGDFLDPAALSRTLSDEVGSQALGAERRTRIEKALSTLEAHLEPQARLPRLVLLRPPGLRIALPEEAQREHPDPLGAAVGVFDGMARRMGAVFRAARLARLELSGRAPTATPIEGGEGTSADLDWQAFTAEELMLVPAVAVVTTGRRLRQSDRGPLSDLLRSSRPVHVIVLDEVGAPDEAEDLSRFHVDLGYLVMAHREAFAFGSTLARPDRAVEALCRAVTALRPAVALIRLPSEQPAPWRAVLAEAALQGRVCPDFLYDPDAGRSWADRFDLEGNPQPDRPWPVHPMAFQEAGAEQTLEVAFTFADAVALEPAYLRHLRIVPRAAWDDTQLPVAEYLERFDPDPASRERSIPYVWVLDEQGTLQRAVVTRELAAACMDRLRSWRVLQELAGYQNVFAERAAVRARDEVQAEAEVQRTELEQSHEDELERVRSDTARESLERLAEALLQPGDLSPSVLAPHAAFAPHASVAAESGLPEAAVAAPPAAVEAQAPEVPEEEEVLAFDEPYIDSVLCTTCNECTNINGQLFHYNDDKQAFIADAAAGTFEELVRAAELCPTSCIHPGKPRPDDKTATPAMAERAAKFL